MSEYGYDTSCTADYYAGRTATGLAAVREHCYRALTTPQGSCPGQGTARSLDVEDLFQEAITRQELARVQGSVLAVVRDDDRIDTATVRASTSGSGTSYTLTIEVAARLLDGQTFRLILAVSELGVRVLESGTS